MIKKHADKSLLNTPQAKWLLTRTRNHLLRSMIVTVLLITFAAALIYVASTVNRFWKPEVIGQHWNAGEFKYFPPLSAMPGLGVIVTGVSYNGNSELAKGWSIKTGQYLYSISGDNLRLSPKGNFVMSRDEKGGIVVFDTITGKAYQTPLGKDGLILVDNVSENIFAYLDSNTSRAVTNQPTRSGIKIWSIVEQREIGRIDGCSFSVDDSHEFLTASGDRLVMICIENGYNVPYLWDTQNNQRLAKLATTSSPSGYFDVNETASFIITTESAPKAETQSHCQIALWDLRSGRLLRTGNLKGNYCSQRFGWNLELVSEGVEI